MAEAGIIPEELRELAEALPGLRNVLVHGYAEIRYDLLYQTIKDDLPSLAKLLEVLWSEAEALDP